MFIINYSNLNWFCKFVLSLKTINLMKLHAIESGKFKLDGGAMFGVVPKTIWQKHPWLAEQNTSHQMKDTLFFPVL